MAGATCTPCQLSLMQQPAKLAMGAAILMDIATAKRRRVATQSVALGILEHFELGIAGLSLFWSQTWKHNTQMHQGMSRQVTICSWLPCVR